MDLDFLNTNKLVRLENKINKLKTENSEIKDTLKLYKTENKKLLDLVLSLQEEIQEDNDELNEFIEVTH